MCQEIIIRLEQPTEICIEQCEISKEYKQPGVWALWGENEEGNQICLEVGQTVNIYDEIRGAIFVLAMEDDEICTKCTNTYCARQRNKEYSEKFKVHACKKCEHETRLGLKSLKRNPRYVDKYKHMLRHYIKLEFVLVDMSEDMGYVENRRKKEEQYALDNRAVYWCG